jgi:uncharacterized protein (TIGR02147 family)
MSNIKIWDYNNYKQFLNDLIKTFPSNGRGQLRKIALKLNVHPTLISQVLNGIKDFSFEQAYGVVKYFSFNENETEYFFELLSLAKSGTKELEKYHEQRLLKLIQNSKSVKNRVGKTTELTDEDKLKYYSNWKYITIWLATSIESLKNENAIADQFNIPLEVVREIVEFLLIKGLCVRSKNGLSMNLKKTHVPASSRIVQNHHINWRLKSLNFVNNVSPEELAFTAPFSVSRKDFAIIKTKILSLIEEISTIVEKSEPEMVACLNIDQFEVKK